MSILKLPLEISKKGFIYRQVMRTENRFMYSQSNKLGKIVGYEVFLNKLGDLRKAKERWARLQNKPFDPNDYDEQFEIFPGDEDFGKRAWSYSTLENAMLAFNAE